MKTLALAYKRLYEGLNYRLRTLAADHWAATAGQSRLRC